MKILTKIAPTIKTPTALALIKTTRTVTLIQTTTRKAHRRPTTPTLAAPITDRKMVTSVTAITAIISMMGIKIEMVTMKVEGGEVEAGVRVMAGVGVEEGVRKGVGAETGTESGVIHSKTECRCRCRCRGDSIRLLHDKIGLPLSLS